MRQREHRRPGEHLLVGLGLVLLAFALRTYGLDIQSLWADEGTSVALAPRPLVRIAQDASRDIHPPLYYFTLHAWVSLTGTSVFAVRGLSTVYGTLLVAVTYALGRRWLGWPGSIVAGTAAALSPFAIHYSQETRMYILMALLGACSWAAFVRLLGTPTARRLVTWWFMGVAVAYTHYFGGAVIVAQNVVWALWAWRRRWPLGRWAWWLGAHVAVAAAYLPWLYISRQTLLNWPAISQPFGPDFLMQEVMRTFSLGPSVPAMWSPWLWGFWALIVATAAALRHTGWAAVHIFAWWLVPPTLMLMLSAIDRPFYDAKFLIVALPGYHLALGLGAQGMASLRNRPAWRALVSLVAVGFLFGAAVGPLRNEWTDPTYWRDDYRGIARTIEATASPEDAIMLLGPGQIEILNYYYKGPLPRYPLPRQRPPDPEATVQELEAISRRHRRLYAVLWAQQESDPKGIIEGWLNTNAFKASDRWYGNVRLAVYEFGSIEDRLRPVEARFGENVVLTQAAVAPDEVAAGDTVRVELVWRAERPPAANLTVFAQLLDGGNHIVGQYDGPPAATPTETWKPGRTYRGRLGVPVLPGTPPGTYRLIVGLYDQATGTRLPLDGGNDALALADVRVRRPAVPPTADALDAAVRQRIALGDVSLLGWRFNKLGFDHAPKTPLAPGDPLSVVLFWKAERPAPAIPSLSLVVVIPGGRTVAAWTWVPADGRYPPEMWEAGEIVRDPQVGFLPGNVPEGTARLLLVAGDRRVELGALAIRAP
ncbi:MAG: glycosyltransferase family 39 protein [Ardenticatenia bacterium]|nr:glycosyltransferase family 39 protein [Ardenticatenia bacterium]